MLRDHHAFWRTCFIATDLAVSTCAFLVAYWIRFAIDWRGLIDLEIPIASRLAGFLGEETPPLRAYLTALPALALVLWVTNSYFKLYQPRRTSGFVDEFAAVVKSNFMAILLLMTFFFFSRSVQWSRSVFIIFAGLNGAGMMALRVGVRGALRVLRARGFNLRHVLIIGTGRTAQELIVRFRTHSWTGIRVRGLIAKQPDRVGTRIHGVPVIASLDRIAEVLEEHPVDQVYIALSGSDRPLLESLVDRLSESFVAVRIVPDIGYYIAPRHLTDFDGLPVVSVWENRVRGWEAFLKRSLDLAVALTGMVITSPLFLLIALGVKLTSRGPIFYVQERMGLDGRLFPIIKFRTMKVGADQVPGFTRRDDDRCTSFGRLLRRTSLDELPQLLNVLFGHMSLVGPRPERPILIEEFRRRFPRYMMRHQVKAGITGWAQVNGWRGDTSLRKRLQYDLYYLRHWSIWFDLKIIVLTLIRGLMHRNAY